MDSVNQARLQGVMVIIVFVVISSVLLFAYNAYFEEKKWQNNQSVSASKSLACDNIKGPIMPKIPPIPSFTWNNTGLITLWFDDAWESQFKIAFPLMEKEKLTGAISVPINFICNQGAMTWNELRILQNNGWEMTSHSISHQCDLKYYDSQDKINDELLGSKKIMMAHGLRAQQFVMPCGYGRDYILATFVNKHPPIVETAEKYYSSYRTTNDERSNTLPIEDAYNLKAFQVRRNTPESEIEKRIKAAKSQKNWLILVFHQIDDSDLPLGISREKFIKVLQMVKQSGLPVVLPSQALMIQDTIDNKKSVDMY